MFSILSQGLGGLGFRGALMKRLREEYLASDPGLSALEKMAILSITNLTGRASWLISRLAEALPGSAAPDGETIATGAAAR